MADTTKVALLGLGRIGGKFAARMRALQAAGKAVEVVAVAERSADSELAALFAGDGVPVYTDAVDALDLGEAIDIVFDLTGNDDVRTALRETQKQRQLAHHPCT